jgi:hypothetical protein
MELAVTCERLELLLYCSKNAGDFLARAFAVLGGKYPEGDRGNFEVNAPVEAGVFPAGSSCTAARI